ncbi:GNAT family N-acetyltransferase [Aspergillus bombycis]|uniref:GNAT family N-acetyltransferase n=1 Tax=Aspergillus bombycis TaxID=109264 RepID=A0A1F7ZP06_9EURO|nr:GNAT family N-acetyltransferase [Aspergillus bombycis]OGM41171.1 GNAT family N-acetyltransferase [Aspergillus bombycis]
MGSVTDTVASPYVLRQHRSGDLGWIVHRHGVLYNHEYGWTERFEGLVAQVISDFTEHYDPTSERCWIAERDGSFIGCVMLVKDRDSDLNGAKLRLLLVEPSARGLGLGRALIQQCTSFAREVGFSRIRLWTNRGLTSARRLYEKEGYKLIKSEEEETLGMKSVGEYWEMIL